MESNHIILSNHTGPEWHPVMNIKAFPKHHYVKWEESGTRQGQKRRHLIFALPFMMVALRSLTPWSHDIRRQYPPLPPLATAKQTGNVEFNLYCVIQFDFCVSSHPCAIPFPCPSLIEQRYQLPGRLTSPRLFHCQWLMLGLNSISVFVPLSQMLFAAWAARLKAVP